MMIKNKSIMIKNNSFFKLCKNKNNINLQIQVYLIIDLYYLFFNSFLFKPVLY